MDKTLDQIIIVAHTYAWDVIELDPIGSSDMISDWIQFVRKLVIEKQFTNCVEAWAKFNVEVLHPIYQIDVPAIKHSLYES